MSAPRQRINLTIDRLVLRGIAREQRDAVAGALVAELQRQLAVPGVATTFGGSRSIAGLRSAPMQAAGGASGVAIGTAVARGIDGVLKR